MAVFIPADPTAPGGGPYLGGAGTAAAPTYAFLASTGMGIYRSSSTLLGFSVSGSAQMTVDSTGIVTATSGFKAAAAGTYAWATFGALKQNTDGRYQFTNSSGTTNVGMQLGTGAQILCPSDAFVQIQPAAGGNGTTLGVGIVLGTNDTSGASLVRDGTGLRSMNGNQTANAQLSAVWFNATNGTNCNFGINIGLASQYGLGLPATNVVTLCTNNNFGLAQDGSQNISLYGTGGSVTNNSAAIVVQASRVVTTTNGGGATQTVGAIPAGALVLGVVARVTTVITGCTTFDVGDGTTATKWGSGIAVAATTTVTNAAWKDGSTPQVYNASQNVVLTAHGGGSVFSTGAIEVIIYYLSGTAPTA